ncbi:RNA polymerase sigma factor [Nakamurella sp. YIM 132087]|uniref:RNA polymerase sigma factor n=1 Tax=Nakamurella alba TaxID=2665158 RepID=A0A7K1FLS1_9ACTN|nr:DUF6596 domain-containing protein [Nakamurella alba]MTD15010.1 RNA polymerase sigma factor [Nakamurella alba]
MSGPVPPGPVESVLRELAPLVLGDIGRRYGDFAAADDAVQEAMIDAAEQWPASGMPANPRGWLVRVASRRLTEIWRSDTARHRREQVVAGESAPAGSEEDTLLVYLLCCHPSLTQTSQVALTLRAVGGLSTAEIGTALLVPESTVAQRISRAKKSIRAAGGRFEPPPATELPGRIATVLQVLYLTFNEGYSASSGQSLLRADLSNEAIRLARQLHALRPADGEIAGLLALMLLTDARRPARVRADGALVPLDEQDRDLWRRDLIDEGSAIIEKALGTAVVGPFQLQAAIAAVHDEAASTEVTDWRQILGLYELLLVAAPGPVAMLGRVVAFAMVHGPEKGLLELDLTASQPSLAGSYRVDACRGRLLDLAGDRSGAREAYAAAARRATNLPEQRHLESKSR